MQVFKLKKKITHKSSFSKWNFSRDSKYREEMEGGGAFIELGWGSEPLPVHISSTPHHLYKFL
jgi:hypothetical protein